MFVNAGRGSKPDLTRSLRRRTRWRSPHKESSVADGDLLTTIQALNRKSVRRISSISAAVRAAEAPPGAADSDAPDRIRNALHDYPDMPNKYEHCAKIIARSGRRGRFHRDPGHHARKSLRLIAEWLDRRVSQSADGACGCLDTIRRRSAVLCALRCLTFGLNAVPVGIFCRTPRIRRPSSAWASSVF